MIGYATKSLNMDTTSRASTQDGSSHWLPLLPAFACSKTWQLHQNSLPQFFSTNFFHNSINTKLLFTPQPIMLLCSSLFVYNTKVIPRKKGMKKWKEKWSEEAQERRERVNHQWWTAFEEVNRKETTCWWWQRNMEETRKKVLLMETKGVWWWYFTCLKGFIDEGTTEKRKFLFFALIVQTKKDSHFHKHTTEIIERSLWSTIFKNQTNLYF